MVLERSGRLPIILAYMALAYSPGALGNLAMACKSLRETKKPPKARWFTVRSCRMTAIASE
jgi:hypothetical protein